MQLTHRTLAVLLLLHLIGGVIALSRRREKEAPVVIRAAQIALGMVVLQLIVASSMILFHLPPVLRSLHEATGVGIWLSCFSFAYLARRASHSDELRHPEARSDELRHPERSEGSLEMADRFSSAHRGPSVAALPQDDGGAQVKA